MRILIALGGNALLRRGEAPDAAIQLEHVAQAAPALAAAATAHQLVITHGNGPQVGLLALESGDDRSLERPYPFDALVAETQGLIGYWLQQSIAGAGLATPIVSVVSQTVVAADDPGFDDVGRRDSGAARASDCHGEAIRLGLAPQDSQER